LPWQPNLGKHQPEVHRFQFRARNQEIVPVNSRVFGVRELKYAIRIFKETEGVALQPNLDKICTHFSFVQIWRHFYIYDRVSVFANSNMLPEFFWQQMALPRQPNVGTNKPKLHWF